MLQWLYTYVASVCSKCCGCFQTHVASVCFSCFRRILQIIYLDVAFVAVTIHICCKYMFRMFHLFQMYVPASASYYKCFDLARVLAFFQIKLIQKKLEKFRTGQVRDVFLFSNSKETHKRSNPNLIEFICTRVLPAFILVVCKHAVTRIIVVDPALK